MGPDPLPCRFLAKKEAMEKMAVFRRRRVVYFWEFIFDRRSLSLV